jgi:signal transduction histidine kinase
MKTISKGDFPRLSRSYLDALRVYLGPRQPRSAATVRSVGRELLNAGCDALDLARFHAEALKTLALSKEFGGTTSAWIGKAGTFHLKVLGPLVRARRVSREALRRLQQRAATVRHCAADLTRRNRRLEREVVRRRAGEASVKQGREQIRMLLVQSQTMQMKLRDMARQVLSAQEDERRKISRELHDEVAQMLIAVEVELAALGRKPAPGAKALKGRIVFAQRLLEKSVKAVHQFARDLRPPLLDDLGLIPALQAYMERLAARKKLMINLTAFAGVESLDCARRTVLFRVAQECLNNVARHARASTVNMIISELPGAVRMEVNDDGKSFSVLKTLSSPKSRRLGLIGMRERVEMVGGTLAIESAPGQGTSVRVEMPVVAGGVA